MTIGKKVKSVTKITQQKTIDIKKTTVSYLKLDNELTIPVIPEENNVLDDIEAVYDPINYLEIMTSERNLDDINKIIPKNDNKIIIFYKREKEEK